MNYYCTLFDSNYLTRGLALYHSLAETGEVFTLYIYCFDDLCHKILQAQDLPHVVLVSLSEFETDKLKEVKKQRSFLEYFWTCTPHVIRHTLDRFGLPMATYIDADLYFYDKPGVLLQEFLDSGASVLITEHDYTPEYDQSNVSGIYCVQFMTFKADKDGLEVLQWWQTKCLEWCFARFEDGRFGDQKYLDDWPQRFQCVHVLQHPGGAIAPWNIQKYRVQRTGSHIYVNDVRLIFYHFHFIKSYHDGVYDIGGYKFKHEVIELLYKPYTAFLSATEKRIRSILPHFKSARSSRTIQTLVWDIMRRVKGTYNVYK